MQAHGSVLMVVDQPNPIGALPIAVARDCGCTVGDLPDLAMRKAADLYPGRSKEEKPDIDVDDDLDDDPEMRYGDVDGHEPFEFGNDAPRDPDRNRRMGWTTY